MARCSLVPALLSLLSLCCSESRNAAPEEANSAGRSQLAGGNTTDFTGDLEVCSAEREETPEAEPVLGFSMTELLAASSGRFDVPLRWQSRCQPGQTPSRAPAEACDLTAGYQSLHDRETVVRMSVTPTGPALVKHPTEQEPLCAQGMFIPAQLQLSSDDGVLAAELPFQLWSECGDQVSINFQRPLGELPGTLGDASQGFPEGSHVEFTAGFFEDRMWLDLYVVTAEGHALFTIAMPPYGQGWIHDVPRTQVEQQPGTPLSDAQCRSTNGVSY